MTDGMRLLRAALPAGGILMLTACVSLDRTGASPGGFRIPALASDSGPGVPPGEGFRIDVLTAEGLSANGTFDARARLAWSSRGLHISVDVSDPHPREAEDVNSLYAGDSVEFFLAALPDRSRRVQIIAAPGADAAAGAKPRLKVYDHRAQKEGLPECAPEMGTRSLPGGYGLDVCLPWAPLGIDPAEGRDVAFQLQVNSSGEGSGMQRLRWHPRPGAHADPTCMETLTLSPDASPPVRVAAALTYPELVRTEVRVAATGDLAGRTVRFRSAVLDAEGVLEPRGTRTECVLSGPLPPFGMAAGAGTLEIAPGVACPVPFESPDARRREAFGRLEIRMRTVFRGKDFPAPTFDPPGWAEMLVGPVTFRTEVFDSRFRRVSEAVEPGRYGAIVTVEAAHAPRREEMVTLYRAPGSMDAGRWSVPEWPDFRGSLPESLGISPLLSERQRALVGEGMLGFLREGLNRDRRAGEWLAGLAETPEDAPPVVWRTSPGTRSRDWWYELRKREGRIETRYVLDLPADYADQPDRAWPLVLFLHGAGERGTDLAAVRTHGIPKLVAQGKSFPFITVSPQCRPGEWWIPAEMEELLDRICASHRVDRERIYLTGLSMGGFGTWEMALRSPHRFAAIAPICGGGDARDVERIRNLPVWAFHGGKDGVVPVALSEAPVNALRELGARPGLTVYPDAGHDSWTETYENPALYEWLLANRLGQPAVAPPGF